MNARLISLLVAGGLLVAPLAAATEETASRPSTLKAAVLEQGAGPEVVLHLNIPGFQGQPHLQVLSDPNRVVVDLPGVLRGAELSRKDIGAIQHSLITKSRIAQFSTDPKPVTRVVLEVKPGTKAEVATCSDGLRIMLVPGEGRVQAKLSTMPVTMPSALPAPVVMETEVVAKVEQPAAVAIKPASTSLENIPAFGSPFQSLPTVGAATLMSTAPSPVQDKPQSQPARQDQHGGKTLGEVPGRYTGTPMSIDVPSLELSAFLRIIGDHAKLNVVADPDTQGRILDVKFTDTPWDLILDIVLKHAGLGKEVNYGVMRIAKVETLQKEEQARMALDDAKALAGELQSITRPLSYSKASEAKRVVEKVLTKRGSMIIDDRTNTLIITDLPKNLGVIDELIATLDVSIQQVQIEARVVEANKGYEKDFGVSFPAANTGAANLKIVDKVTYDASGIPTYTYKDAPWGFGPSWNSATGFNRMHQNTGAAWTSDTSIGGAAGTVWLSFLSNRISVNTVLQALERDGVVKIVSAPKVVTQNNKKAKILAGQKIPYPTNQGGAAGGAISVAFVDANLQLDVTPQITSDATILMDLKITKSEADFSQTVNGSPTILQKEIETQVLVHDGGTAVLGGVYTTSHTTENRGIPFLRNLPILGWMFRSKTNKEQTAELLVFITPRILKQ